MNVYYMNRFYAACILLCGLLLFACQKPVEKKDYIIGVVNPGKGNKAISTGFIEGLGNYGFKEGSNATFLTSQFKGGSTITDELQILIDRKADLIFTVTTPVAKQAKRLTNQRSIPVLSVVNDPIKSGIISTPSSPGGNLTSIQIRGSVSKALEWLLAIVPEAKNILIPISYDTAAARQSLSDLKKTAKKVGINLMIAEVNNKKELQYALATIPANIDAIFLPRSILLSRNIKMIVAASIISQLPVGGATSQHENGVLICYGMNTYQVGKQASRLANIILKGKATAGEIPMETAEFFLGINLNTAQAIGLTIPDDILQQADYIAR